MAIDVARRYVAQGADLLDREGPKDWRERVDVELLNTASCVTCVLGQLYGDFEAGVDQLGLDHQEDAFHGFNDWYDGDPDGSTSFWELNQAWRELLEGNG